MRQHKAQVASAGKPDLRIQGGTYENTLPQITAKQFDGTEQGEYGYASLRCENDIDNGETMLRELSI
jgi:hypothetical protein